MGDRHDSKPVEAKVYFTEEQLRDMEQFREEWTQLTSRNQLFHKALQYYMHMVKESQGVVGPNGFPVRGEHRDKQGHEHTSKIHPLRRPRHG